MAFRTKKLPEGLAYLPALKLRNALREDGSTSFEVSITQSMNRSQWSCRAESHYLLKNFSGFELGRARLRWTREGLDAHNAVHL